MTPRPALPGAKGIHVQIDKIEIPPSTRPYDAGAVKMLAESISSIGLQSPPTVIQRDGKYRLVAGRHRIEALRTLEHESVFVRLVEFTDIDARLWTISENLHRAELSVTQRSEHIAEFADLVRQRQPGKLAQVAPVSGGRGNEGGERLASRELGLSREDVRRAKTIAYLPQETKEAARDLGYEDNQSALLAAAKKPNSAAQIVELKAMAARGRVAPPAVRSLKSLENISGGEFARWVKATSSNSLPHAIRVMTMAAGILTDEMAAAGAPPAEAAVEFAPRAVLRQNSDGEIASDAPSPPSTLQRHHHDLADGGL